MASYEKRKLADGSIKWKAIVSICGIKQSKTFRRKTDAKLWAETEEHKSKEASHLTNGIARTKTIQELVDHYVENDLDEKEANTIDVDKRYLNWWAAEYGSTILSDFTPATIAEGVTKLKKMTVKRRDKKTGELNTDPPKPATINRKVASISSAFDKAMVKYHWISTNPFAMYQKEKINNARNRFLNDEKQDGEDQSEYVRLLTAVSESRSANLKLAFELAVHTGGRKIEVLGLRWSEISFNERYVKFNRTKNKDVRAINIPEYLIEQLRERKKYQPDNGHGMVFPNTPLKGNPVGPICLKTPWGNALKKAEIYDFQWHDLRHTHASFLAMEGASLIEIAEVLGQRTLQMVKRYAHLSPNHVRKTSSLVSSRLANGGQ